MSFVEPEPVHANVLGQQVEVDVGRPAGRSKSLPFKLSYFETVQLPTKTHRGGNSPVVGRTFRCWSKAKKTGKYALKQELLWSPFMNKVF